MKTTKMLNQTPVKAQVDQCLRSAAKSMRMSQDEEAHFVASPVAQLIASLPFLAECEDADRSSCAHLMIYVGALRNGAREIFDHRESDNLDMMRRLEHIMRFRGGDSAILDAGMARLALVMIYGYLRDVGKDSASGEYNPVLWGQWDAQKLIKELMPRAKFGQMPQLDEIMGREGAKMLNWKPPPRA